VPEYVSILLPLSGEARRVGGCLRALLDQVRLERTEIVALDDGASPATVAEVRRVVDDDPRVRMLTAAAPPNGWARRTSACHQLAVAARGSVYVYVDPDVLLERHAIAATVTLLRHSAVQLLAPLPRQPGSATTTGPATRTRLPVAPTYLTARLPWVFPSPGGQLLAVDATSYWRSGGHAVAADLPRDDTALSVAIRRSGGRCAVADGSAIATLLAPPARVTADQRRSAVPSPSPTPTHAGTIGDTARRLLLAMVRAWSHE
jgi:hypothetical protein